MINISAVVANIFASRVRGGGRGDNTDNLTGGKKNKQQDERTRRTTDERTRERLVGNWNAMDGPRLHEDCTVVAEHEHNDDRAARERACIHGLNITHTNVAHPFAGFINSQLSINLLNFIGSGDPGHRGTATNGRHTRQLLYIFKQIEI